MLLIPSDSQTQPWHRGQNDPQDRAGLCPHGVRGPVFPWLPSLHSSVQLSLSHVRLFATPWTTARQASLSISNSWSPPNPMSIESVMPSNHLILCHPLLLLPSIFPSIGVFSNELALHIRWLNYWSFSFNISSSQKSNHCYLVRVFGICQGLDVPCTIYSATLQVRHHHSHLSNKGAEALRGLGMQQSGGSLGCGSTDLNPCQVFFVFVFAKALRGPGQPHALAEVGLWTQTALGWIQASPNMPQLTDSRAWLWKSAIWE